MAEGRVISDLTYSVPVHEGHRTRSGSVVAGRPYLVIGLRRQIPKAERDLRDLTRRLEGKKF